MTVASDDCELEERGRSRSIRGAGEAVKKKRRIFVFCTPISTYNATPRVLSFTIPVCWLKGSSTSLDKS
jgi:hypothetical protein